MKSSTKYILIIAGIIVLLVLIGGSFIVSGINSVVAMDENVKKEWAQVDNQLQRRFDLIPNLVETVKGYASQEKDVFIKVTEARSRVGQANNIPEKIEANNELTSALSRLLLVVENYPQLKSNENFIRLQDELAGTENRIAVARMRYNDSVNALNAYIRKIPGVIFARISGIEKASYFEAAETAKEAPKVNF